MWRTIESERLDQLLGALWQDALDGDPTAANTVIRIIDQRCRLLGLYPNASKKEGDAAPTCLVVGPIESGATDHAEDQREPDRGKATQAKQPPAVD